MGGFVTIATAALHADRLTGVIVCDSPVTEPDPEVESFRLKEAFGSPRTYAIGRRGRRPVPHGAAAGPATSTT